ncbi:MAG: IS30 family transposase [Ruminococcaceae bacterium]|nr:IS30 family transposase [Oscillospiraceae bacterium]
MPTVSEKRQSRGRRRTSRLCCRRSPWGKPNSESEVFEMCRGKEMSYHDRLIIESMYNKGYSIKEISRCLGVDSSTLYREIPRGKTVHKNTDWTYTEIYSADRAQQVHDFKTIARSRPLKVGNDYDFINYLSKMIRKYKYSPRAILADIKRNDLKFSTDVSYNTIYRYVENGLVPKVSRKDLPYRGKRKKRKPKQELTPVPLGKLSIETRPDFINSRAFFGHWEMDSVIGKREKGETLIVLTERKTRLELVFRSKDKSIFSTVRVLNRLEKKLGKHFKTIFKTITVDNGPEFNNYKILEKSIFRGKRTTLYYCHPFASSERGSNEKQNQMLRRWIVKFTKIEDYTDKQIKEAETWLNNYPRAMFGFKSSKELFDIELEKLGLNITL